MTETMENREQAETTRGNQPLKVRDRLYFILIWWGVESWSKVNGYKDRGYLRKYKEARLAMKTGMGIYGLGVVVFLVFFVIRSS